MSHPHTEDSPSRAGPEQDKLEEQSAKERKVDEERREIERGVYERRSNPDDGSEAAKAEAESYSPSDEEVNRGRLQGLGVGQKDLDAQRDPTRAPSADQYGQKQ